MTTRITIRDNGPYRVEGEFEIYTASGQRVPFEGERAVLCRCGGSMNKPFCDSTHSKIGFQAAEAAVQAAEESRPRA